ncbi:MAG: SpoIIE family protein phosphatase [Candidatus Eisenbacteria bacterium]|nr:SpoIIE family protein phosphatase [Candidatus Latescibacterota bacterium]MBD3302239.1 SpoIIE family protein phosphatase [Candidatus Eisenbacteria bacterium]
MGIEIRWEAACERGRVREKNEDSWGVKSLGDGAGFLLAVADGMGGHPGGEVASRAAVQACIEGIEELAADEPAVEILAELFRLAQDGLRREAEERPSLTQMGTTLTLLLLRDDGAWVGHIGDTRLFWIRDRSLALITEDHSAAWEQVRAGKMSVDEAERDPMGSLLTRHLGPRNPCNPDLLERPLSLRAGDRLLLCSDGLGKVLSMAEVREAAGSRPLREARDLLVRRALEGGGPDNITVVVVEVISPPDVSGGVALERFPHAIGPGD